MTNTVFITYNNDGSAQSVSILTEDELNAVVEKMKEGRDLFTETGEPVRLINSDIIEHPFTIKLIKGMLNLIHTPFHICDLVEVSNEPKTFSQNVQNLLKKYDSQTVESIEDFLNNLLFSKE